MLLSAVGSCRGALYNRTTCFGSKDAQYNGIARPTQKLHGIMDRNDVYRNESTVRRLNKKFKKKIGSV